MRIALIADAGSPHTRVWVDAFAQRGHEVHLFSPHKHVPPRDLPAIVCAPLAPRRPTSSPEEGRGRARSDPRKLRTVTRAIRLAPAVRRWVAAIRPDRLIALRLQPEGYLALASGFKPYGIMSWGQDVLRFAQEHAIHRWLARPVLRGAALLIGETDEVVTTLQRLGGRQDRILKGFTGINTNFWRPPAPGERETARAELLASHPAWAPWLKANAEGARIIFSPRSVDPHGHQRELIRACAMPRSRARGPGPDDHPEASWILIQAGAGDAQERAACQRLAGEIGLPGQYFDVGPLSREDLRRICWLSSVMVSLWAPDGLSQSLLECVACGVRVVAADIPGNREWIAAAGEAWLVDPKDPVSIGRALLLAMRWCDGDEKKSPETRRQVQTRIARNSNMERMITAVLAMDRPDPLGFPRSSE